MTELKGEPFNVLTALAMGLEVREVSPSVLAELLALDFVSLEGDSVHITGEGKRVQQRTTREALEFAASWPMIDFDGMDGR